MKINRHKLLHYVLIILLMLAPMRSVMAMQQIHCDMGNHITGHDAESSTVISDYSDDHDMMAMSMAASTNLKNSHDCCSDNNSCVSGCDMNISVSLLTQES